MIPYTTDPRPDTGVNNITLGIWLFLASEAMLFAALFSAYALLRTAAPVWPDPGVDLSASVGLLHTAVLVGATGCVWRATSTGQVRSLWYGTAMAGVFLVLKGTEYVGEFGRGWRPSDSTFLATYITLTGLHALHVLGGALANVWVWAGANGGRIALTATRIEALGRYWVFVDLIWLIMFVLFYLA